MGKFFGEISSRLLARHGYDGNPWAMSFAERLGLAAILSDRRPKVAIEIGTLSGGSLSVIAHYAEKVYSIDLNPDCAQRLGAQFPNVEFLTGDSSQLLPPLLHRLRDEEIGFILIDGDHSETGVLRDILAVLDYRPRGDLFILMHDSFNPDCRRAMKSVDWASYPQVHWVDFDFIPGFVNSVAGWEDEMWCGFALAYLRAEGRDGPLEFDELLGRQFERFLPLSKHAPQTGA